MHAAEFGGLRVKHLYLLAILLFPGGLAAEHRVPTVNDQGTLAPAVSGEVAAVIGNLLVVRQGDEETSILTDRNTHFFTFYGGVIYLHGIAAGNLVSQSRSEPADNARGLRPRAVHVLTSLELGDRCGAAADRPCRRARTRAPLEARR